ncbi:MAG: hypothetical protein Q9162_006103 [Coniocarpon cinnabarinum]
MGHFSRLSADEHSVDISAWLHNVDRVRASSLGALHPRNQSPYPAVTRATSPFPRSPSQKDEASHPVESHAHSTEDQTSQRGAGNPQDEHLSGATVLENDLDNAPIPSTTQLRSWTSEAVDPCQFVGKPTAARRSRLKINRFGSLMPRSQLGKSLRMYDEMVSQLLPALQCSLHKLRRHPDLFSRRRILLSPEIISTQSSPEVRNAEPAIRGSTDALQQAQTLVERHLRSIHGEKWRYKMLEDLLFKEKAGRSVKTIPGLGVVAARSAQVIDFQYLTSEVQEAEAKARQQERQAAFKHALGHLRPFAKSKGKISGTHMQSSELQSRSPEQPPNTPISSPDPAPARRSPVPTMPKYVHLDNKKDAWRSQKAEALSNLTDISEKSEPPSAQNSLPRSFAPRPSQLYGMSHSHQEKRDLPITGSQDNESAEERQDFFAHSLSNALQDVLKTQVEPFKEEHEAKDHDSVPLPTSDSGHKLPATKAAVARKTIRPKSKVAKLPRSSKTVKAQAAVFTFGSFNKDCQFKAATPTTPKAALSPSKASLALSPKEVPKKRDTTAAEVLPLNTELKPEQDKQEDRSDSNHVKKTDTTKQAQTHALEPCTVFSAGNCSDGITPTVVVPPDLLSRMRSRPPKQPLDYLYENMKGCLPKPLDSESSDSQQSKDSARNSLAPTLDTETTDES